MIETTTHIPLLEEALELADTLRPTWPAMSRRLHLSGVPLNESAGGAPAGLAPAGGGEGAGGSGDEGGPTNGLYEQFLGEVPEEIRPYAEAAFKKWESGITPKLQEAADLRKRFEPLAGIEGLEGADPEELSALLGFRDVIADPEQFSEWVKGAAERLGIPTLDTLSEEDWVAHGEANGFFEDPEGDDGGEPGGVDMEAIRSMMEEMVAPLQQAQTQQTQAQQVQEIQQTMASELDSLEEQHGEFDREAVIKLAHAYVGEKDAISRAFADYQQIRGGGEGERVDRDLGQPVGALSGGRASTEPEKFTGLDDPRLKEAAAARFRST